MKLLLEAIDLGTEFLHGTQVSKLSMRCQMALGGLEHFFCAALFDLLKMLPGSKPSNPSLISQHALFLRNNHGLSLPSFSPVVWILLGGANVSRTRLTIIGTRSIQRVIRTFSYYSINEFKCQ